MFVNIHLQESQKIETLPSITAMVGVKFPLIASRDA